MNNRLQVFFTHTLILTYALASIFGHVLVFNELINCVSIEKQFNSEKKSRNPSSIPLWTQKKHIPVFHKEDIQYHFSSEHNSACNDLQITALIHPVEFLCEQKIVSFKLRPRSPPPYSI